MKHIRLFLFFLLSHLSIGNLQAIENACYMSLDQHKVVVNDSVCYLVKNGSKLKSLWEPYCGVLDKTFDEPSEYVLIIDKYDLNADTIHIIRSLARTESYELDRWISLRESEPKKRLERRLNKIEKKLSNEPGVSVSGTNEGIDYVDLGLPSGLLWATCNVGANNPTDRGKTFVYNEIMPDTSTGTILIERGRHAILRPRSDSLENSGWHLPTIWDQRQLLNACDWIFIENFEGSGISGFLGVSKRNGKVIFFPAKNNDTGIYWSNTINKRRKQVFALVLTFKKDLNSLVPYENMLVDINSNGVYSLRQVLAPEKKSFRRWLRNLF